jgi:hypothetical protein
MRAAYGVVVAVTAILTATPALAGHFHVVNKLPANNVCKKVTKDRYGDFRKAIDDVIKSGVIGDIDKTIDKTLSDNKIDDGSTVDVEINIASSAEEYQKAMHADDTTASDEDMQNWFDNAVAHTDIVGKEGHRKIVVYVFCGDHLQTRLTDGFGARTFIHELVHAQLYAMSLRGLPEDKEPYKEDDTQTFVDGQGRSGHADEHNEDFNKIVERLTKLFEGEKKPKTAEKPKGTSKSAEKPKKRGKVPTEPATAAAPASPGIQLNFGVGFGGGGNHRRDDRRDDAPGFGGGGLSNKAR